MNKVKTSILLQVKPTYTAYPTQKRHAIGGSSTTNNNGFDKASRQSGQRTTNSSYQTRSY